MTRNIYTFLLYLLLPFTPLKLLWRSRKQPEYLQHWRERYGFYTLKLQQPVIWLHCVSVGETRAAEPLIKALLQQYPHHQILITHTTPTGRAASQQLFGNSISRAYLPFDLPFAVNRFLKQFKPVVGVLMETELWFNLIAGCKQHSIPLLLVNARLSEKSARGYSKLGILLKQGLSDLNAVTAQTRQDARRLLLLGANNVSVTGNLKFDVAPHGEAKARGQLLRNKLGKDRPVFLAASTRTSSGASVGANERNSEEAIILEAVAKANVPNLLTIIVPRHPQRFNEVADFLTKQGVSFVRRSALGDTSIDGTPLDYSPIDYANIALKPPSYLLGDSMGEMFTYYAICDVAFIGGSLLPLGGQNLIEACSMGKPVLIGPHTFNFTQATEKAIASGAAQRVKDVDDLARSISHLFADIAQRNSMSAAGLQFTAASRGATQRVLHLLQHYL